MTKKIRKNKTKNRKNKTRKGGFNINLFGKTHKNKQLQECKDNTDNYYRALINEKDESSKTYKKMKMRLRKCYELEHNHYTLSPIGVVKAYYAKKHLNENVHKYPETYAAELAADAAKMGIINKTYEKSITDAEDELNAKKSEYFGNTQMKDLGEFVRNEMDREGIVDQNTDPALRRFKKYLTRKNQEKIQKRQTRKFIRDYENTIDKDTPSQFKTPIKTNTLNTILPENYNLLDSDDIDNTPLPLKTTLANSLHPKWEYANNSDWRNDDNDDDYEVEQEPEYKFGFEQEPARGFSEYSPNYIQPVSEKPRHWTMRFRDKLFGKRST